MESSSDYGKAQAAARGDRDALPKPAGAAGETAHARSEASRNADSSVVPSSSAAECILLLDRSSSDEVVLPATTAVAAEAHLATAAAAGGVPTPFGIGGGESIQPPTAADGLGTNMDLDFGCGFDASADADAPGCHGSAGDDHLACFDGRHGVDCMGEEEQDIGRSELLLSAVPFSRNTQFGPEDVEELIGLIRQAQSEGRRVHMANTPAAAGAAGTGSSARPLAAAAAAGPAEGTADANKDEDDGAAGGGGTSVVGGALLRPSRYGMCLGMLLNVHGIHMSTIQYKQHMSAWTWFMVAWCRSGRCVHGHIHMWASP